MQNNAICVCGDHEIDGVVVQMVAQWIVHEEIDGRAGRAQLIQARNVVGVWIFAATKHGLLDLLRVTQRFQVTDPRNKIYDVLGLMDEFTTESDIPLAVFPDYTKLVEKVYHDVTKFLIDQTRVWRSLVS